MTLYDMNAKYKRRIKVVVTIVILTLVAVGGHFWSQNSMETPVALTGLPARGGERLSEKELEAFKGKPVKNTRFQVRSDINIESDGKTGEFYVRNIPTNKVGQQAVLMDKNGKVLYETGLLEPGYENTHLDLKQSLEKGEYPAQVKIKIFDLEKEQEITGMAYTFNVTLHVV
ncbi:hypothetical protein A5844_001724 [Enterococcus sp. 10A9_DIV0425]|uniref:Uncharacterized protein n=1 Tax=Candidatus Enterococcus wittei TaxID=1987383 RepID=A0A242JXH8_9ENTE|nr:hypothetical protein [Enterococcus sp. 10A9_DIV0425]OTP10027.1 hypothetical protein A5844_001724 [Enterococcus sp. 10A9_DIV0425]THE12078.1 hypothetical protein E1H99_07915 [Enterococcus hirae]